MRIAIAAVTCFALMLAASSAHAAQRYAAPSGSGSACTQAAPCSLTEAMKKAKTGDEVIVTTGSYTVPATAMPEGIAENVFVHGDFNAPMPTVQNAGMGPPISFFGVGGRLSYLEITGSGTSFFGFNCFDKMLVERVAIRVTGQSSSALFTNSDCQVRDSVLRADGQGAVAITASTMISTVTQSVRNVTAIASGAESIGLRATANGFFPLTATLTVDLKNSIVQGDKTDIYATAVEGTAKVLAGNSNFDKTEAMAPSAVTDQGGNQSAAPQFVDAAKGDYREAAGSPTIDAGTAAVAGLGALDLAGNPRVLNSTPDIGAFEFEPAAATPTLSPPTPGDVTSLSLRPKVFKALKTGGAVLSKKAKAPLGTTVTFGLTGPAAVTFSVERVTKGRKVGKNCMKPTPQNKGKKACPFYKSVNNSGFVHPGAAGQNQLRYSGRLRNKALAPGAYRLVAAAGTTAKRTGFTVVK